MITMEFQKLTQRQKEVCLSFIKSKGIDIINFISNDLCIEPTTTKTHINDIYHKLLVNSHAELMYYLMEKVIENERNNSKRVIKKYKKSISYFTTILCRPEFNQFIVSDSNRVNKYIFKDCVDLHKMLIFFMERKYR